MKTPVKVFAKTFAKTSGATIAATSPGERFQSWLSHHKLVCSSTFIELAATPVASMMTWLVIGIALALPAILYVVLQNVALVSGDWGGKPRVSLYLSEATTEQVGRAFAQDIAMTSSVEKAEFISSHQALVEFQQKSGFGDVMSTLDRNPLPHVIELIPVNPDPLTLGNLIAQWQSAPEVERVSVDLQWLERLYALLVFAERLVFALAFVLGLGVMLVMGNTIRLAIENRRQEIEIVKLVGGTDGFVRRPFLYLGFWYGMGGALFAFVLLQVSLAFLAKPVEILAQSYRDDFALQGPEFAGFLVLMTTGVLLGVLGATLAVSRHLSEIEPT